MPGLVRKLLIFSTLEGLVLQAHGPTEHHRAICIDYHGRSLSRWTKPSSNGQTSGPRLESFGIIGLLNVASLSFLIAITRREQVAQIYGRPVFVVTDIALLPISSHEEANIAIAAAAAASSTNAEDEGFSDSDSTDSETETHRTPGLEVFTPLEDDATHRHKKSNSTNIAEDVARRKASYGKFASDWFSKRVWGPSPHLVVNAPIHASEPKLQAGEAISGNTSATKGSLEAAQMNRETPTETVEREDLSKALRVSTSPSTLSLLPKLLRSTKMILSSRSFYFSYDFDMTRRLSLLGGRPQPPSRESLDPAYFWNRRLGSLFTDANCDEFLLPIVQGFVGQRTFTVKAGPERNPDRDADREKAFLLTLISRRSTKRAGLRYLRRGIDDEGNCANTAETEQILSSPRWENDHAVRSFVQVRGSIPLYFSQSPYSLKPVPIFHNTAAANQSAFQRHFQNLKENYGAIQIAMLVNKHGVEQAIGEAYEKTYKDLCDSQTIANVDFEWFDFHAECRGMKFENVERLVSKLGPNITSWGETVISQERIQQTQQGVIRTNCMDCLDRTNVAQSAFGQHVLQRELEEEGFHIDLIHDESTNWFNTLWADNGDAISRQYASTAALKGDFTRTRKRNWQGAVNDLGLTLSRYYSNMVNDYFSQAVIDVLLGNVSWKIFEDFESTMMSADPGISVSTAREAAIENCAKIVVQDPNEDLIHGWTLLSPAQENTLRTFPFQETVVLLTDAAIYCCKFDWNIEKVASFEKVHLKSISRLRHGTYVTSTFTSRQTDEDLNQGVAIVYTPCEEDVIRVNTRSLQNVISTESRSDTVDGGTGLLSWVNPGPSKTSTRTLALKVMPHDTIRETGNSAAITVDEKPRAVAEHISGEIRRAIESHVMKSPTALLVEEGDIISVADARRRTGYLEQLGHSLRRLVWA